MRTWYQTVKALAQLWSRLFTWMYPRGLWLLAGHAYLLLETRGRQTCRRRVTPLGYVPWAKNLIVQPLHGKDSDWVRNIKAHPEVTVILGRKRLRATMRVLDNDSDRRRALAVISSSWTISGLTARKHFSLLGTGRSERLESVSQERDRLIILVEPRQVR